jgi:hypothetical protein
MKKDYLKTHLPPGYVLLYKDNNRNNYSEDNIEIHSLEYFLSLPPNKYSRSHYRGLTFNKHRMKWVAQLNINNKNIYIGSYTEEIIAHKALMSMVSSKFSHIYNELGHHLTVNQLSEIPREYYKYTL